MKVRITTLIENNPDDEKKLSYEHGLSLYIEADGKNILFDTGQSGDFIMNAKTLNNNLELLDYCIISHGHYDHSGGFEKYINAVNKVPQMIVGEEFFKTKYKTSDVSGYDFIGNSFEEKFLAKEQIPLRKVQ